MYRGGTALSVFAFLRGIPGGILFLLALYSFMTSWAAWRTRNLPKTEGGWLGNPFNDRRLFCCVYGAPPCPRAAHGCISNGVLLIGKDLGSPLGPVLWWVLCWLYMAATVVGRGSRPIRVLVTVCMGLMLLFGPEKVPEAVHVLIFM